MRVARAVSPSSPPLPASVPSGGALNAGAAQRSESSLTLRPRAATNYSSLYSFKGYPLDGAAPVAALIDVNGELYGTTVAGGRYSFGAVFRISTSGAETELYSFGSGDGFFPAAALVNIKGALYGTTEGSYFQSGSVFEISPINPINPINQINPPPAIERVLYSFCSFEGNTCGPPGLNAGSGPTGALIDMNGTLYGTTLYGGTYPPGDNYNDGTVFALSLSGTETVLHSFGLRKDGFNPTAALIEKDGELYGTTEFGGDPPFGTVFAVSPAGSERVIHSFGNGTDGTYPISSLIDVNGEFYGTTAAGGVYGKGGTVFAISTSGAESVLHSFGSGTDGAAPSAELTNVNGTLYGATAGGGLYGHGTVFKISTSGAYLELYSFKGGTDGASPVAGLVDVNGALYGTTVNGGGSGFGTVFRLQI